MAPATTGSDRDEAVRLVTAYWRNLIVGTNADRERDEAMAALSNLTGCDATISAAAPPKKKRRFFR